jgi:hypothetical protein
MNKVITIAAILFLTVGASAQQKEFNWLLGTWKLKDKNVYERWTLADDRKSLEGISYRIKESDTVVMEKIRFTFDGTSYHYRPDVAGPQSEVDFTITSFTSSAFVAENPQHDFPKLIRYNFIRKDERDCIDAAIEGNGKVIPYNFERVK